MLRSLFEPVSLLDDAHQGLAVALVVSAVALVGAVLVSAGRSEPRTSSCSWASS